MKKNSVFISAFAGMCLLANSASAAVIYGFEEDSSSLAFTGTAGRYQSGQVTGITATEGNLFAYLTTGPDPGDGEGVLKDNSDSATMNFSFTGEANSIFSLDYNVVTTEITSEDSDYFTIALDGNVFFGGVIGIGAFQAGNFIKPAGMGMEGLIGPDGSRFEDGYTGWYTLSITLASTGLHTLSFLVDDGTYHNKDTALLVDNIQLTSAPVADPVPEPATMLLMASGIAGICGMRRRKKI